VGDLGHIKVLFLIGFRNRELDGFADVRGGEENTEVLEVGDAEEAIRYRALKSEEGLDSETSGCAGKDKVGTGVRRCEVDERVDFSILQSTSEKLIVEVEEVQVIEVVLTF